MDKDNRRALPAALLDFPGLAAICRGKNCPQVADRKTSFLVRKEKSRKGKKLTGGLNLPMFTAIVTMQNSAARPTGNPNVIPPATDRVKVPFRAKIRGEG